MTDDLGIDEGHWGSVENTYDDFAWELWTAMTQPYHVTMNGEAQDLTLLQIHYEHLRAKYHWEHQAYAEWEAYQTQCVGLLMTTLNLEKHSLQARIELLKQKHPERDTGAVESRLKKIQDCINQAAGYKGKDANGNEVDYPGLFSDKTRANQYWMYKQRDGGERYYWTPGHEILFYTQVNTQNVPQENPKAGVGSNNAIKLLRGVSWQKSRTSESCLPYAKFSFWKPFIRYKGGDTLLASADQLKTIYKDYGGSKHLYDIFIGEDEGNFQGLVVGNNTTFGDINGGLNYVEDTQARDAWGRWNASRAAKVHSFGAVNFSDVTGIDGNLTTAASVAVVENTVTTAIDDLDELAEVEF